MGEVHWSSSIYVCSFISEKWCLRGSEKQSEGTLVIVFQFQNWDEYQFFGLSKNVFLFQKQVENGKNEFAADTVLETEEVF